ncbi:MAG: efflux RND transporter periplasmic adaptor subunit [Hydrotalea sp.]|nr:efflux RND transporter periplasmic adaptor subunit [Hydrotalea sp.]
MEANHNPSDDNKPAGQAGGHGGHGGGYGNGQERPVHPWQKFLVPGLSAVLVLFVLWWLLGSGNGIIISGKGHDEKMANQPETGQMTEQTSGPMMPSNSAESGATPPAPGTPATTAQNIGQKTNQKTVPDIVVLNLTATDYQPKLLVTGTTQPVQLTTLKSQVAGRIEKKMVVENTAVKTGAVLIKFQVADNMDKLIAAQKQLKLLQIAKNSEAQLATQGLSSNLNMAQADANLAQARATVSTLTKVVEELNVKAPFDGALSQYHVEVGDLISPGQPLADFADLKKLYVQVYVAADQVKDLVVGAPAQVTITGDQKNAVVAYVGSVSDSQTGTVLVKVKMDNSDGKMKGQVPASVAITLPTTKAYRIPPTSLSLSDEGLLGIKILGEGNKVMFAPVTVLAQDATSMWVSGLPAKITLLSDGQAFVSNGQIINPVYKNNQGN